MIRLHDSARLLPYLMLLALLNLLMATATWGSAWLSLIVVCTYLTFRPQRVLHPNNMVFAFYGLYVVLSSTLNLTLDYIDWEYVLPWGQQVFWDEMSKYLLFQVEFTFLVLFFSFHVFCKRGHEQPSLERDSYAINEIMLKGLYVLVVTLVLVYMQSTAGIQAWINDYSFTYLTKREGHGLLNIIIITLGNTAVFLMGLKAYKSRRKLLVFVATLPLMVLLSFIGGVKSRFIFLLLLFLAPLFMTLKLRLKVLGYLVLAFFVLLYVGTLVRTEGFYSSAPFFIEMLIGYFNAFQLHDWIVTSREPALFQTVGQIFAKPMQLLGMASADPDADFDISVMLTKEYFPDQWDDRHATQQWPLDTELYLNYYGPLFSWLPLLIYAAIIGWLYRNSAKRNNLWLLPVFVMEFQRIFSTLRGTLLPWALPVFIVQYLLIYALCKTAVKTRKPVLS